MKVLLVGCGAVGLSVASALYTSNAGVELVARGKTAGGHPKKKVLSGAGF